MLTVLIQAHMCTLDIQPPMQSVPITTKAVSSNPDHDNVYCDKVVNDFRQVGGFLRVLRFPLPIKLTQRYN
jgi:hypothetical protein